MTNGYRTTYWVLFALMVLSIFAAYSRGEIGVPGGLGIAVAVALIRDWQIRRRLGGNALRTPLPPETAPSDNAPSVAAPVPPSEDSWAQAILEFDGGSRRTGLWAQLFAEAGGSESAAKVKYLQIRSTEIENEKIIERAAEKRKEAAERARADAARQEALRKAHQIAEAKAKQ